MDDGRVNVLGVGITPTNIPAVVEVVGQWISSGASHYICVTGMHGVIESQRDPSLKRIHNNSGLTVPDGMPMVWLSHLAGHRQVGRVYGPDLMLALSQVAEERGYKNFFYGGAPGVAEQLGQKLQRRFPNLQVCGAYSPPFRPMTPEAEAAIVAMINKAEPDILWVGLGTPKQEKWMAGAVERLTAPVLIGVGAAFDIHSLRTRQAPRWMQRSGLEWFFRLMQEPGRLWSRYLLGNLLFAWHLFLQGSRLRRYPLEK